MVELAKEVHPVNIEDELKQSYLDYAMSVIVGRALPDVRDGLKPVHRRVLFAMSELGNEWNKPMKKSARVVGDVIGKYHPHGDTAVYDTIVRMAQPFSMRYLLVDGQGNFGSVDGDAAAAMRYTEVRMSRYAHELLKDLDKETVDFAPNYDETEFAPTVLPTRVPNLLVNGASGIAVGMATNIPPHNLREVITGCLALIEDPDLTIDELMKHIPGPDFPTGATINGISGIVEAYRTGRGRIYVRSKVDYEEEDGRVSIVVTELPYQVNKARLIEKIAELVKDKKIEGITNLRDESDKDGMRIVIEVKRHEVPEVIVNNLYAQTPMESVFGINMVALVDGQPRTLNLKQIIEAFLRHRKVVVNRRTTYELRKARERAHILEGWSVALANVDEMIQLIKTSPSPQEARDRLLAQSWSANLVLELLSKAGVDALATEGVIVDRGLQLDKKIYLLSEVQAQAILDLKLQRLTGLEQDKIFQEYESILEVIKKLVDILMDPEKLMSVIRQELIEARDQFGDARRSEILASKQDLSNEDLISEESRVVTLSYQGYVKTQPLSAYVAQRRGGRGKAATAVKDEDFVDQLIIASSHDTVLCFSSRGKAYWLKVYQLPLGSRNSRGKPIVNLLPLQADERISAILPLQNLTQEKYIVLATAKGVIKKLSIEDLSRPRTSGIIAVDLDENDHLVGAQTTNGERDIMLFSDAGKVVRFHEKLIRAMGRTARGVRGIKLQDSQQVISLIVVKSDCTILTATENGYGKRTPISDFPVKGRGGQGVISIQTSERNGLVVGAVQVEENDEIMMISSGGTMVRTRVGEISVVGRNTQGVTLIQLSAPEKLVGLERIPEIDSKVASAEGIDVALLDAEDESEMEPEIENDDDHEAPREDDSEPNDL